MERVAPLGPMYQAGTLSGNPIAVAAGIATLQALQRAGAYDTLERLAATLEEGLAGAAAERERSVTINRVGSLMTIFFNPGPVEGWDDVARSDTQAYAAFFHRMLEQGVYLAPSAFEAWFVSLAHSEDDVEQTVQAARQALA